MFLNLGAGTAVSSIMGIIFGLVCSVLVCVVGDKIAPRWQEYFDLPEGVTCTTFDTLFTHYPLCWMGAWIYDHIPGLNKVKVDAKKLEASKIGSWGSVPVLTFIISVFLLIITKNDVKTVLSNSITITASVILMPKCVSLLMEGLVPVSNAARKWASEHLKIDGMLVGMDVSIGLGDPNGMTTTLALLPICIALAFIIPGVSFIPIGLFSGMIWTGHAAAYMGKGNLIKSIFAGTFICAVKLVALTVMAPICTRLAFDAGVVTTMTQLVTGGNIGDLPNLLIGGIGKLLGAF
jgi:PTS system galactitol-specific IIC component